MGREYIEIEKSWRFSREAKDGFEMPDFDDREWEVVDVPHDWAIKGPFNAEHDSDWETINWINGEMESFSHPGRTGGLPHSGKGFYRREVHLPVYSSLSRARLEIDGIMSNSRVYCNGKFAGGRPYGYSSFSLDLSGLLHEGRNVVAVSAENFPAASRWYPGAGIYRHIRLVITGAVHIEHWGVRVTSEKNRVRVSTSVANAGRRREQVELETGIFDSRGSLLTSVTAGELITGNHQFSFEAEIPGPEFWRPESPHLYKAVSVLKTESGITDRTETVFGLRDIEFHPEKGFLLNGERTVFKGVCLHHDLGPLGAAVNRAAMKWRLSLLKEMGCNALRTAHNPPAPELLDLCDEMGFLVIDEAFDEWEAKKMPNGYNLWFSEWAETDLRDMIRRDANHPSVIMWSIGNEISEQYLPNGTALARSLCEICHAEDPSRPVTAGLNDCDDSLEGGLFEAVDIHGMNYKPHMYSIYHARHPGRLIYSSESASTVSSRGEYSFPLFEGMKKQENLQIGCFDMAYSAGGTMPDHEFKAQDENPFVMGEFVWTGFDYLGEPTPYREEWPARSSYYGIIDLCGIPKDRYYLYQSRWTDKNVLHVMPHWTWPGREGQKLAVQCYTNSPRAELFVNGVSQGVQIKNPKALLRRYRLIWTDVVYQPGELKVVALDSKGRPAGEKAVLTAGKAERIRLLPDREYILNDGEDMVFITAEIVDSRGTLCPFAGDAVVFSAAGPAEIAATGNGDPASLEDFRGRRRKAFRGKCAAYLRSVKEGSRSPGEISVTAEAGFGGGASSTVKIRLIEE